MPRIYYYKLTNDDGGAPCVQNDLLSLAICKPKIRTTAKPGDLIFGFAASSLSRDNRLIYIAEVTAIVDSGEYYERTEYRARGDCIYERTGNRFRWRVGALHHGPDSVAHDLGEAPEYLKARVLLSRDFRYLGNRGTADYKSKYPLVGEAVEQLGRGHRVRHDEPLTIQLLELKEFIWDDVPTMKAGEPTLRPRRQACHREKSCGIIDVPKRC